MKQAPVLNLFDPGKYITMTVDASKTCLGAALLLKDLISGHHGIVKTVQGAKTSLCWPGMQTKIADLIETCDI